VKAVTINHFGGPEAVMVTEMADPTAGDGEVLVRVHAAAIGSWDVKTAAGNMHEGKAPAFPMILGWDFAGVVERAGAHLHAGDRVFGFTPQAFNGIGAQAEIIAVPAALLSRLPGNVEFVQGSILPVAALTARLAIQTADIQSGMKVLIVGAAGQVGGFATQLALARHATVIASIDPRHADDVHHLGHFMRVDRHGDVATEVHALIPGGVDVALDFAGGQARASAIASLRGGGHYVTSAVAPLPQAERGIKAEVVYVQPDPAGLDELARAMIDGQITARLGETIELDHARRAYQIVAEGSITGKVVLNMT
jgi:NADPH:quinone reductase-like Zn-dependent oxidoreductase